MIRFSIKYSLTKFYYLMGRKCLRKKKMRNLLLRSGPQKNREKLEIKEFITEMEYLIL